MIVHNSDAEGHSKSVGSAVMVENSQVLAQARNAALDELGKGMVDELRRLSTSRQGASDPSR